MSEAPFSFAEWPVSGRGSIPSPRRLFLYYTPILPRVLRFFHDVETVIVKPGFVGACRTGVRGFGTNGSTFLLMLSL